MDMEKTYNLWSILAFLIISTASFSCQKMEAMDFASEPADPDSWDLSVWENVAPGTHSGFGSLDVPYPRSVPPEGQLHESIKLSGWKGERVNCKLLVWTAGTGEEVSIRTNDLRSKAAAISQKNITISVVKYVLTDQFLNERLTPCGPRENDQIPAHLSPDILEPCSNFFTDQKTTRPVWISVEIPADAVPGIYEGTIIRKSSSGTVKHPIALEVQDKVLPPPLAWSFHLDLWQNPFAVARYHHVELWSEEHMALLRPYLTMLANEGQKCITTILIEKPWEGGSCYDGFRSMINWKKRKDGAWEYDYTNFDKYVSLAMECGISKQISCYTMVPIENNFTWYDEARSKTVVEKLFPGTKEYEEHWTPFLLNFRDHLKEKGWLDLTAIGLDERKEEEMAKMFSFIGRIAPEFKIAVAGFYHKGINLSIYDFCSNWRDWGRIPLDSIRPRREAGLITTYYVACGIPKPNNFTFSPPAESCFEGWMASALGFDGFLRWAYNSWPENPLVDSRYIKWPAGDTYFIYPGPLTSVRFERLREGIQDYEKIRILREDLAADSSGSARLALEKLNKFLSGIDANTLEKRPARDVVNEGKQVLFEIANAVH